MSSEEENKEKEKKNESKHAHSGRWPGRRQRRKLTPEESEKILRRVFLGEDD